MRTIKFRGKCCHSDAWVFGDLEVNRLDERTLIHTYYDDKRYHCQCDVRADTVGQFTGLYDKNGEEIYEGDILQWGEGDYKIKQVVMFLHGAFGYKCDPYTFVSYVGNSNFNFWAKGTDNRFEIIGNIHDNPELLEGGGNG